MAGKPSGHGPFYRDLFRRYRMIIIVVAVLIALFFLMIILY
ncbi:hypothetical protein [Allorhizobium sonneratiae]|nr:hypothetical protein [Allorhizobium sonneratiae]